MTRDELYTVAIEADRAFQSALIEYYSPKYAADARYLPLYKHPPHIRALGEAKVAADKAYLACSKDA